MKQFISTLIQLLAGALLILLTVALVVRANASPSVVQTASIQPSVLGEANAGSSVIAYQGRLLDPTTGQPKPDGAYTLVFNLYNVETGGVALWTETKNVATNKGLFTALLGDTTAFPPEHFNGQALYLGVAVGGDPEATPRQRVASVAYAIYAEKANTANNATTATTATTADSANTANNASNADKLDGQDSTAFAISTHDHDATYLNTNSPEVMAGSSASIMLEVKNDGTGLAGKFIGAQDYGVMGHTNSTTPGHSGVYGTAGPTAGVSTPANQAGVLGKSADAYGVVGYSKNNDGVYGHSTAAYGVRAEGGGTKAAVLALAFGSSATNYGLQALSSSSHGVYADGATYGFYTPDKVFAGNGYSDIAEHMPAAADVGPGDVVVIDPNQDEYVIRSYQANDPMVAGVISSEPAMLIGNSESKTPLALAGRVPVKVSAENGAIHRGDLLTTSNTPGHAMKATAHIMDGVAFYTPGTIIGKAMGELESGTGTLIVLVLPQ